MHELWTILIHHWVKFCIALLVYLAFNSFAEALPPPSALSPKWYTFFFMFIHGFAGNLRKVIAAFRGLVSKRFGVQV